MGHGKYLSHEAAPLCNSLQFPSARGLWWSSGPREVDGRGSQDQGYSGREARCTRRLQRGRQQAEQAAEGLCRRAV